MNPGAGWVLLLGLTAISVMVAPAAELKAAGPALAPGINPGAPVPIPGAPVPAPGAFSAVPGGPAPLAPPVNPGYAPAPSPSLSPILTQPGPLITAPERPYAPYPPLQLPGPIDQQKTQSYRDSLIDRQWQLQRQGVSPADPRSREIQQQLNQPRDISGGP